MSKQMDKHLLGMRLRKGLSGWIVVESPENPGAVGLLIQRNSQKFAYKWLVWNQVQHPRRIVGKGNTMKEALLDATKTWGCSHCDDTHTSVIDKEGELHYNCPNGPGRYYLIYDPEKEGAPA